MIDQLPDLALYGVLSYLNCEEKIRLKAVCKRLNCLLTHHLTESTRRLFVYGDFVHPNETWDSRNRPIRREESIQLNLFLECLTEGYFKGLKILFLHSCAFHYQNTWIYEQVHQTPLLNCLAKLDELFITYHASNFMEAIPCPLSLEHPAGIFNLPGLKSFSFKTSADLYQENLKIHSQSLERLVVWNHCFNISLSNPEKVEYIECERFSESFQQHAFPNLIELYCANLPANFDISNYPKLRKLLFCPGEVSLRGDQLNGFHIVDSLVRQRKQLERFDLEILVSGFKGLTDRPIAIKRSEVSYFYLQPEHLERLKENFSNFVGPLPWQIEVVFPASIELARNLSRYLAGFNIFRVELEGELDPDLVIEFLQEISGVYVLTISCEFGLPFYAQLSSVPFIHTLGVYRPVIDCFDFLCSIKTLQYFDFQGSSLPIDHFGQLIERSKVNLFEFSVTPPGQRNGLRILFEWSVEKRGPNKGVRIRYRETRPYQDYSFETVQESIAFMKSVDTIRKRLV